MIKKIFWIAFAVIVCLFNACSSSNTKNTKMTKEIMVTAEEVPNYIFHLMTLGNIVPEDPEYISLYKDSLPAEDQAYLSEHRDMLYWGDGNTAVLTVPFFFIPAYINFQSSQDFNEYFDLLSSALHSADFNPFITKYNSYIKKMELMFGPINMEEYLQALIPYSQNVDEIGNIYKRNFQSYHLEVWPKEKIKLEQTAALLNTELQKYDLIGQWEKLIGKEFETDNYQIILFSSNKNGPNANSLGYERNTFYYGNDPEFIIQFISHEVGTHLLIENYHEVMQMNQFEFSELYGAFENLAEFYSVDFILKNKNPLIGYDVETYYTIYQNLYEQNKNITPNEFMIKGLERYNNENP